MLPPSTPVQPTTIATATTTTTATAIAKDEKKDREGGSEEVAYNTPNPTLPPPRKGEPGAGRYRQLSSPLLPRPNSENVVPPPPPQSITMAPPVNGNENVITTTAAAVVVNKEGGYGLATGTTNTYVIPGMDDMTPEEYREQLQQTISARQAERRKQAVHNSNIIGNRSSSGYLDALSQGGDGTNGGGGGMYKKKITSSWSTKEGQQQDREQHKEG